MWGTKLVGVSVSVVALLGTGAVVAPASAHVAAPAPMAMTAPLNTPAPDPTFTPDPVAPPETNIPSDSGVAADPASPPDPKSSDPIVAPGKATARDAAALAGLSFAFNRSAYELAPARPNGTMFYGLSAPLPKVDAEPHDKYGVRLFCRYGQCFNHPVAQGRYGLSNMDSYRQTKDPFYLDRAKAQAKRLMETAVYKDGAWYMQYPFVFYPHGSSDRKLNPPWYSAMAQGHVLSLFVSLYKTTGDTTYQIAAHRVFRSYTAVRGQRTPWTLMVDENKYLWFEEYAGPSPDKTLNGHIFALYGVYDYWLLTKSELAKVLVQGGATTVAHYMPQIRTRNWLSKYCIRDLTPSKNYHVIHMGQMLWLHHITNASIFAAWSDTLAYDFPNDKVPGRTVRLLPGTHVGKNFNGATVTSQRSITLTRASQAPVDTRSRVYRQAGIWVKVTAGSLAGHWVQEDPKARYLVGWTNSTGYLHNRKAKVAGGATYTGYEFDAATGLARRQLSVTADAPLEFESDRQATWNGIRYVYAVSGPFTGFWLPQAQVTLS